MPPRQLADNVSLVNDQPSSGGLQATGEYGPARRSSLTRSVCSSRLERASRLFQPSGGRLQGVRLAHHGPRAADPRVWAARLPRRPRSRLAASTRTGHRDAQAPCRPCGAACPLGVPGRLRASRVGASSVRWSRPVSPRGQSSVSVFASMTVASEPSASFTVSPSFWSACQIQTRNSLPR